MYCKTNPPHPRRNSNNLYPLHRVLVENSLGRLLLSGEDVHHKDGCKENNDINNLQVMTKSEHAKEHKIKYVTKPVDLECGACGLKFQLKPHVLRLRSKRNSKNNLYCSRKCGTVSFWKRKREFIS